MEIGWELNFDDDIYDLLDILLLLYEMHDL